MKFKCGKRPKSRSSSSSSRKQESSKPAKQRRTTNKSKTKIKHTKKRNRWGTRSNNNMDMHICGCVEEMGNQISQQCQSHFHENNYLSSDYAGLDGVEDLREFKTKYTRNSSTELAKVIERLVLICDKSITLGRIRQKDTKNMLQFE